MTARTSYYRDKAKPTIPFPDLLSAALGYAEAGKPVFPLWPGGKGPVIIKCPEAKKERLSGEDLAAHARSCSQGGHGFHDATTDPQQIKAWWKDWPKANIGIPTGERSGWLVVDIDPRHGGRLEPVLATLEGLEIHCVKTGGGGWHLYFRDPPGDSFRGQKAGEVFGFDNPSAVDIKANGGLVVAPPSVTTEPYTVLNDVPIADHPPERLLEALREQKRGSQSNGKGTRPVASLVSIDPAGEPISEGARDDTLTRIAGKLHDDTRTLDALTADLLEINKARCVPPLPEEQVAKIARSIYHREPCKKPRPLPTPEALEAIDWIEAWLWRIDWPGMGGKSERDALVALIKLARECGTLIPAGIRVGVSVRAWALAAAVSKRSMLDYRKNGERKAGIISRLKKRGLIRSDNANRQAGEAGAFVLILPREDPRARFHHSPTAGLLRTTENTSGETLRAPRLRWSAPVIEWVGDEVIRTIVRRLGKGCGALIDMLVRAGGTEALPKIAEALGIKRPRDVRRRYVSRLKEAGVVECSGDIVALTPDWLEALDREREVAGEIAAERRDRDRYEREREAYRNRHRNRPARSSTEREMCEWRESAPKRRRRGIGDAVARLFLEYPEYRCRRVGQITCALIIRGMVPDHFLCGVDPGGLPKDWEVAAILEANGVDVPA